MFDIKKVKAVLWDLDDTLYSRYDAARKTFPGMFRENLYPERSEASLEEAAEFMMTKVHHNSMIHKDAFSALLEKYPPDQPYDRDACVDYYYAHITDFAVPFSETLDVVTKLRERGIKTAIVTNISEERLDSQKKKIEVLGIEGLFDEIVYSGELGIHKPDKRIFEHAAKCLNVKTEECVFVGDDPESDAQGAKDAGMEVVWIDTWGHGNLFPDDPRIHRVQSVLEYFNVK